ncbi:hypothetical protein [Parenemella sanctibonifatiensis]|uniref:Uncharacterized protein n=1 Tax=Parenemella sanctibonifatiensis TaxID=2016505 RepID=A0A255ECK9_9ACTN|nr:hypothetical protein [Parenemella sanctibonifatiensis]OYN89279.1 hypothetical protein CGZ92_02885 [Parenemella sanctibonifatiensis]
MTTATPTDRERLEALRDRLEAVLADPDTAPRDLASVSREFRLLLATLAQTEPAATSSPLNEIAARRKKRSA